MMVTTNKVSTVKYKLSAGFRSNYCLPTPNFDRYENTQF